MTAPVDEAAVRAEYRADWSIIHTDTDRWLAFRHPGKRRTPDEVLELEAETLADLAEELRKASQ